MFALDAPLGAGGDPSLKIDRDFEEIALDELRTLIERPETPTLVVSEERGGDAATARTMVWVVVDPIDGSTNIANGLPQFSLSVALASGPTMADVWFGFVHDFGTDEEFVCEREHGVEIGGAARGALLEVPHRLVAFESAEPQLMPRALDRLAAADFKEIRVIGSIAIALCYVALGRVSGLVTCKECRSVDAAAGQLIASELGAALLFDGLSPESAGLSLDERYRLVAGRDGLTTVLREAQDVIPLVPR